MFPLESGWLRGPLAASLAGFRHHWPERFARAWGPANRGIALMDQPLDPSRYLKLRRIAIASLARAFAD